MSRHVSWAAHLEAPPSPSPTSSSGDVAALEARLATATRLSGGSAPETAALRSALARARAAAILSSPPDNDDEGISDARVGSGAPPPPPSTLSGAGRKKRGAPPPAGPPPPSSTATTSGDDDGDDGLTPAARKAAKRKRARTVAPPDLSHLDDGGGSGPGGDDDDEGPAVSAARALLAEGYVSWTPPRSDPDTFIIASVVGGARNGRFVWAGGGRDPRKHGRLLTDDGDGGGGGGGGGNGALAGGAASSDEHAFVRAPIHPDDVAGSTGTEAWEVSPTGYAGGAPLSVKGRALCPPGPAAALIIAPNERFILEPDHGPDTRRIRVISGPNGVGKSTLAYEDAVRFRSLRPHKPIYLITALEGEDESLPSAKVNPTLGIKKVDVKKLTARPLPLRLLLGALVIVDDIESMTPPQAKAVRRLIDTICVRGRCHRAGAGGVSLIVCMHLPTNREETRTLLNECDVFTFFPYDPGSYGPMLYALQKYVGLSGAQAQAAMREKTRVFSVHKHSPRIAVMDGKIMTLPRPFADKAMTVN